MKLFIAVIALCVVGALGGSGLTEEQKAKMTEDREKCTTETGVDAAVVDNAKKGNFAEGDEKLACFSSCMLKKMGIMNADGSFNEEVARSKEPSDMSKEKVDEIINKCKGETGDNECQTGLKIFKCYTHEKSHSMMNSESHSI